MKRAKFGAEKVRKIKPLWPPNFHAKAKRRKIPEKSGGSRRDAEAFYGKERKSHAVKSDEAGQGE